MTKPILKWAGGKGKLLPQLLPLLPGDIADCRYLEPFIGGGAMFFHLQPTEAVINDANTELVTVYTAVKGDVEELIENLSQLAAFGGSEGAYYAGRTLYNNHTESLCDRAALFIYLNRTCFNGLYRVNKAGEFNVPYGKYKNPRICDPKGLRAASEALCGTRIMVGDYRHILVTARRGDFIYFDPPYAPLSATSNFVAYTKGGFGSSDQVALREVFGMLHDRGCKMLLSNSDTPEMRALYAGHSIHEIEATRAVGASAESRGVVGELAIRNY